MKERITEILEEHLSVTDEWGGCKLAGWQWGHNVLVAGTEDAAQKIVDEFANVNQQLKAEIAALADDLHFAYQAADMDYKTIAASIEKLRQLSAV